MSGHNKWSKIKYVKAKEDAKKGKVFARFAHEIMLAAKSGGGDPDLNPRLRAAIDGAKAVSTPKENIERAIKKGTGELGGATIQEITYEGYGPSGTAFLIEVATDNTNRSASELRTLFTKNGGSIGTPGSVAYQFERKGEARIMAEGLTEDSAMDLALECGADDVEQFLARVREVLADVVVHVHALLLHFSLHHLRHQRHAAAARRPPTGLPPAPAGPAG